MKTLFFKTKIKTKEDAIKFLARKLYDEGKLTSYEEYLEAVMYRETLSPTGFEKGLRFLMENLSQLKKLHLQL